jgi:SAM-dependent methyltransferase
MKISNDGTICLPIDIATKHTLAFVEQHTNIRNSTVLEVGCGQGHLAKALSDAGANVTAVDVSEEAIASVKEKGIRAIQSDFTEFHSNQKFDMVVFSRSLHHIQPLNAAVRIAHTLLKSGGVLIVEDFAAEKMDESTLNWLRTQKAQLPAEIRVPDDECKHRLHADSLAEWNAHLFGKHHVSKSSEMLNEIRISFSQPRVETAIYLYRYLIDYVVPTEVSAQALAQIYEAEQAAIDSQQIVSVGWRITARKQRFCP